MATKRLEEDRSTDTKDEVELIPLVYLVMIGSPDLLSGRPVFGRSPEREQLPNWCFLESEVDAAVEGGSSRCEERFGDTAKRVEEGG